MPNARNKCFPYFILLAICCDRVWTSDYVQACSRDVYCKGNILHTVQMSKAFGDAKNFVDMPMKDDPNKTIPALTADLAGSSGTKDIANKVRKYFGKTGTELISVKPTDWKANPTILNDIKDKNLKYWAKSLNDRWEMLTRQMKEEVKINSTKFSLIYSKEPFVVPGGRFREFYYWDTYWIIDGLLLCDMKSTVRGMIENFIRLVDSYGFVPNGGRVYYLNRSQPPFLTLMVMEYWKATNDTAFLEKVLPYLEKEYEFWMKNRVVQLDSSHGFQRLIKLNRYSSNMGYPRPESYWNDVETAKKAGVYQNMAEKQKLYSHIASAAESGWDFSSRWFALSGKHSMKMESIKTRDIVPVDLNAILCKVEKSLSSMFEKTGNISKSNQFKMAYEERTKSINDAFWDETKGQWLDFDMETKKRRTPFYISNISPIWGDCFGSNITRAKRAIESIKKQGVFNYPGGVPTSLNNTGEQWDFPNAWPPLQDMLEIALRNAGYDDLAYEIAKKWINTNYLSWKPKGDMAEKFDVTKKGEAGGGGEYKVQLGFGWTNGVVLKFLHRYGARLEAPPDSGGHSNSAKWNFNMLLSLAAFYILYNIS